MKKFGFAVLFFILGFVACIVTLLFATPYIPKKKSYSSEFAAMERIKSNCSVALERELKEELDFQVESVLLDPFKQAVIYQIALGGKSKKVMKDLHEARAYVVKTLDTILALVNEKQPEFRPCLNEFPFPSDRVVLNIDFPESGEVIAIFLRENYLYYYNKLDSVQFFSESLNEADEILKLGL